MEAQAAQPAAGIEARDGAWALIKLLHCLQGVIWCCACQEARGCAFEVWAVCESLGCANLSHAKDIFPPKRQLVKASGAGRQR